MAEFIIGTNGSGANNIVTDIGFYGILEGISITPKAGMPVGTTVTVKENDGLKRTLVTRTGNTAVVLSPQMAVVDAAAAAIAGAAKPYVLNGKLNIVISGGSNNVVDAVTLIIEMVKEA